MPTTRQRYQVTETDDVQRALEDAARRWPGTSRSRLLLHLVAEGHRAVLDEERRTRPTRREAVALLKGSEPDSYEPGYLASLREDWPS